MHPLDYLALTALPTYSEVLETPPGVDLPEFHCMTMIEAAEWLDIKYRNVPLFATAAAAWAGVYHEDVESMHGFRL